MSKSSVRKFGFGLFGGLCFFFLLGISSCTPDKIKNIPDVSHISVDISPIRFEKELFSIDTNAVQLGVEALEAKYPKFSTVFFEQVIPLRDPRLPENEVPGENPFLINLEGFLKYPAIRHLNDTTQTVFGDFKKFEEELEDAFRYYKHYFPNRHVPDVYTFISEYSVATFTYGDSLLAIGLDMFFGSEYPLYYFQPVNLPRYLTKTLDEKHLTSKVMFTYITEITGEPQGSRMLDIMVHKGKQLYLLDKLLPRTEDSIKIGIGGEQLTWLEENENQVWAFFIEEDHLYSNKVKDIRKYIEPSPDSPGMPPEAPGNSASWVGWQIVKAYMERYPETRMDDLLKQKDAQYYLDRSKYKPER